MAIFYSYFTLKPAGEHSCVVCTGTACYINGAAGLLAAVKAEFGVKPGETTPDGRLSVLTARCVGACSLAPVVVVDGEASGRLTPAGVVARSEERYERRPHRHRPDKYVAVFENDRVRVLEYKDTPGAKTNRPAQEHVGENCGLTDTHVILVELKG